MGAAGELLDPSRAVLPGRNERGHGVANPFGNLPLINVDHRP